MSENIKIGTSYFGDDELVFNYVTFLNAKQKIQFVNEFSNLVVHDGDYYNLVSDMMFDFMVIRIFTDIDTSFIEDEDNISAIENIVNETNIVNIVKANVNSGVIEELRESCELNIEYKTGIHRNVLDEAISDLIGSFERTISNVDMDDMMRVSKMLVNMQDDLTPERMIEAFANTDIYKKNRNNI